MLALSTHFAKLQSQIWVLQFAPWESFPSICPSCTRPSRFTADIMNDTSKGLDVEVSKRKEEKFEQTVYVHGLCVPTVWLRSNVVNASFCQRGLKDWGSSGEEIIPGIGFKITERDVDDILGKTVETYFFVTKVSPITSYVSITNVRKKFVFR